MQEYTVKVYVNRTEWYQNNKLHREDGPAIEYSDGSTEWWKNDKRHRDDGPAVEFTNGYKQWCRNGKFHRLDGPAVEFANGRKEYYINGKHYTEQQFNEKINPTKKEMTVAEIEAALGYSVKIVKG